MASRSKRATTAADTLASFRKSITDEVMVTRQSINTYPTPAPQPPKGRDLPRIPILQPSVRPTLARSFVF
jgi:hypothetical protein